MSLVAITIILIIASIIGGSSYYLLSNMEQPYVPQPEEEIPEEEIPEEPMEEKYKFFLHKDSAGGDIEQIGFIDSDQMKTACSTREGCKAFNTAGWLKRDVKPMEEWTAQWNTNSPVAGLWVKEDVSKHLSGYIYLDGKDSDGGDLKKVEFKNIEDMRQQCNSIPECKGFNKSGWLKHTIKPVKDMGQKDTHGLWAKVDYIK